MRRAWWALALLLAMYLYTRLRHQSFVEGCDRFAFSAALGTILVRIGNLFNSEIVGKPTFAAFGVRFPRYDTAAIEPPLRHPSQLYEALLGLGVLLALWWADRALGREQRPRGALISLFLAGYFCGRFVLEFWKEAPAHEVWWGLNTGQWLSLPLALAGAAGAYLCARWRIRAQWNTLSRSGL